MILGIDIGNVIIGKDTDTPDQFFNGDYLSVPPIANSFETIKLLTEKVGPQNVFIVSKCGANTQEKSREYLRQNLFFATTGVYEDHVFFCRKRHEKAPICEEHNITVFIDDRYSVMEHLITLPKMEKCFLFNPSGDEFALYEEARKKKFPGHEKIIVVKGWNEIAKQLL